MKIITKKLFLSALALILLVSSALILFVSCKDKNDNEPKEGFIFIENINKTYRFSVEEDSITEVIDGEKYRNTQENETSVILFFEGYSIATETYYSVNSSEKPFDDLNAFLSAFVTFTDKVDFYGQLDLASYETVKIGKYENARKYQIVTPSSRTNEAGEDENFDIITDVYALETGTAFYIFSVGYDGTHYAENKPKTEIILNTFEEITAE